MVFGSVLAKLAEFQLDAADGQSAVIRNTMLTRLALKMVGVPHIGLRIRAGLVFREIRKFRPRTVIDAGAGNGLYTLELASCGFTVQGIEINHDKASRVGRYAREAKLPNATLQTADLTVRAEKVEKADLVICSDVLEHIESDAEAVATLAALVRDGGLLVVTVPRVSPFAARVENRFGHVRVGYTENQLGTMLESSGFEVLRIQQFFKTFGRMAWMADRGLRHSAAVRALAFWPLYMLAKLDGLIPDDDKAGGILMVARCHPTG
jgi:SAM-dependent methyltransferase